jgi:RNA polymerase sigma-70 factor, ECF subfamily
VATRATDEHAFGSLLDCHRAGLELFCQLMLGDSEAARQAMAETVMTAWRERRTMHGPVAARMWLYRIATDVCIDATEDTR